jgi:hypothetical protein
MDVKVLGWAGVEGISLALCGPLWAHLTVSDFIDSIKSVELL